MSDIEQALRLIAFYLPQFHPIPENDKWWGKGFTEWTNVVNARPRFPGHYQPHLPADLGFYDLRLPEVREEQAELARQYGIHGFCYYHYWFSGRRLLERPFNEVLGSGRPEFPFCLCWANDSWNRVWDGVTGKLLIKQEYDESDDREHMRWLSKAFLDPRYIRIHNKPLFLVYRASSIPDPKRTTDIWREEAHRQGIGDIYLGRVESLHDTGDPVQIGFDAAVEFQPHFKLMGRTLYAGRKWSLMRKLGLVHKGYAQNSVVDYDVMVERMLQKPRPPYPRFPSVAPSWDNSARRQNDAIILRNSTPDYYERWLSEVIAKARTEQGDNPIIFINAWNEWAEGCHLEPCQKWGRGYLEATKKALEKAGQPIPLPETERR